jgi:hypothetical protein
MKKTILILLATFFCAVMVHAQKPEVVTNNKPGWHKIGDANVNFKTDKDEFVVIGKDRFKSIRLKVTDAPVHLEDLQVFYEGGGKEDVPLKEDFSAGSESRVIPLKNNSAEINKVTFIYRTQPNKKVDKAHIELWGLK